MKIYSNNSTATTWKVLLPGLISGLLLFFLTLTAFYDINGGLFKSFWLLHIIVQAFAVITTMNYIIHLSFPLKKAGLITGSLILLIILASLCLCLLPVISRDALIYHLSAPKLWIEHGSFLEISWHQWSHFPLMTSLGYAGFILFKIDNLCAFYHYSFLILFAGTAAVFVQNRFKNNLLSLFAFFLSISIPLCIKLGTEPMADLSLSYFFFAACTLLLCRDENSDKYNKSVIAAGIFLGLALSTKYNSLLAIATFTPFYSAYFYLQNRKLKKTLGHLALIIIPAAVIYLPWPLKNYLWTGNPVYPFLGSIFSSGEVLPFFGELKPLPYRLEAYNESILDILLIPVRMLFLGEDDNPKLFDGRLTPIFLLYLLPLIYVFKAPSDRNARLSRFLIFVSIIYFVLSLILFYALVRYQSPMLGFFVFLTCYGLYLLSSICSAPIKKALLPTLFLIQLLFSGAYITEKSLKLDLPDFLRGRQSREKYIEARVSESEIAKLINSTLPEKSRTMLLYTGNRFYLYNKPVAGHYFSFSPLKSEFQKAGSNTQKVLYDYFQREAFTHIAMHNGRTSSVILNSSPEFREAFKKFMKEHLELIQQTDRYSLWRIKN